MAQTGDAELFCGNSDLDGYMLMILHSVAYACNKIL